METVLTSKKTPKPPKLLVQISNNENQGERKIWGEQKTHHWKPTLHAKEMKLKIFGIFQLKGVGIDTTILIKISRRKTKLLSDSQKTDLKPKMFFPFRRLQRHI